MASTSRTRAEPQRANCTSEVASRIALKFTAAPQPFTASKNSTGYTYPATQPGNLYRPPRTGNGWTAPFCRGDTFSPHNSTAVCTTSPFGPITRPVTVADNETKQVEFVSAAGVKADTFYVYDGSQPYYAYGGPLTDQSYGVTGVKDVQNYVEFTTGKENGLDAALPSGVTIAHAATARDGDRMLATGGRVLGVVSRGEGFTAARAAAYIALAGIRLDGAHYRHDIAERVS